MERNKVLDSFTNPGANATFTVLDQLIADSPRTDYAACSFWFKADQAMTVNYYVAEDDTATPVLRQTLAVDADTFFEDIVNLLPGRNLIQIATTTAPGSFRGAAERLFTQAPGQVL
jgi:hypothetical protein